MKTNRHVVWSAFAAILVLTFQATAQEGSEPQVIPPQASPVLRPAIEYKVKDNTVVIELAEYSGYSGLIVANRGLEPNEDTVFYRDYGFKVRLTLNEREHLDAVQMGEVAGFGTTADVLAVYGQPLEVVCPAMFGFSRGAEHLVLRKEYKSLRDVRGKTLIVAPFTETEFFLRYLCRNNGLEINVLQDLSVAPVVGKVNLVYAEQVDHAIEIFGRDLDAAEPKLAGCVGWPPGTTDLVQESAGKAYINLTDANQLVVADVLLLNKGFAARNPRMVKGIVHGLIDGNRQVLEALEKDGKDSAALFELVAASLTTDPEEAWTVEDVRDELASIGLANHAVQKAFFTDSMPQGGSFAGIYQESEDVYGDMVAKPAEPLQFIDSSIVEELGTEVATFQADTFTLKEISGPVPTRALAVWRDVNFVFQRNVYDQVPLTISSNVESLQQISRFMRYSPGARVELTGHLDDSEARRQGEEWRKSYAPEAQASSVKRAEAVRNSLVRDYGIPADHIRIDGKGWDQPVGTDPEANRRVEVRIFTLE